MVEYAFAYIAAFSIIPHKEVRYMDIASLSTALSMSKLQNDFSVAMFAKQLDTYKDLGEAMTQNLDELGKQMELSVNPSVGSSFDASV